MNHQVPDFLQMEDICSMPTNSRSKNPATGGEGVTELLWENGHVIMQSQRPPPKIPVGDGDVMIPAEREIRLGGEEQHLFMQEHEMAAWLQDPLDDFYTDLLSSPPPAPISTITQPRVIAEIPSPPPPRPPNVPRLQSFGNFSRLPARPRVTASRESTVVESNKTPMVGPPEPRVNVESGTATAGGTSATAGELAAVTCEQTVTSSSLGGSRASLCASGEAHPPQQRTEEAAEDRKRKARENDDNEYQSEDTEFEAAEAKKAANGSTSTKRSRAAEVHNLSERKRRDRINERMKILQELIPRCNKADKASMLDEAIEYLKSLQMQVQLMYSMGYPMVPMMYPGMQQQYMPAMGYGNMGMNQPMVPYHPSMLPSSSTLNPAHMGPTFPMPAPYPMPQVHMPDPRTQASSSNNQANYAVNFPQYQNQPGMPNFVDPYQQYVGMYQGQYPTIPQNHEVSQPGANKPSTSKDVGNQP